MKLTLLGHHVIFIGLLLIGSINLYAQKPTLYNQLQSVNAEWKNQPDIDPALLCIPAKDLSEQQLIQFHLQQTELLLRKRSTVGLTAAQEKNRLANLNILNSYWQNGIFPVNDLHAGRQPYFIDKFNTYCAVGYLMQQSGADEMAKYINRTQNYNYLINISAPGLMNWVFNSGLSLDELALIQPAYDGLGSAITELHYNNTGADINEYIEVHQHSDPFSRFRFATVLFYDHMDVLYRTMPVAAMQTFTEGGLYYYYLFPANESLADSGKIELLNNLSEKLFTFFYNSSGVITEKHNPINSTFVTKQYNTIEDNNTAVGSSLQFCGNYYVNSGPNMWQPLINPASIGNLNPCIILAVNLTSFTYTTTAKAVQLKWQTASESNLDHFSVERSSDGITFNTIGKVNAAGTSNTLKQYSLTDNGPGYLNHYRLKQLNLDGSFSYSQVLYVKFPRANPISIITNPVNTNLKININSVTADAGNILVYDFHGKQMLALTAKPGRMDINVSALPAGKYMLQLQSADGKIYNQAFIKQ